MNATQLFNAIEKELRGSLDNAQRLDEIALLFAWIKLDREQSPSLISQAADGDCSLREAYKGVAETLAGKGKQKLAQLYQSSQLPIMISDHSARNIAKLLWNAQEVDAFSMIDELYQQAKGPLSKEGLFIVPDDLAQLMYQLSGPSNDGEVYAPFAGSLRIGGLHAKAGQTTTTAFQEGNPLFGAIALLADLNLLSENPIHADRTDSKEYSIVQMLPPLGVRVERNDGPKGKAIKISSEILAIEHALARCNGKIIVLVPQGVLFRGARDYDLRVSLVEKGYLDAVIQLPQGMLPNTGISTAILVIDKQREKESPVFFYDASSQGPIKEDTQGQREFFGTWSSITREVLEKTTSRHALMVSAEEIKASHFDLSVSRYVRGPATKAVFELRDTQPLSAIAKLIRAQPLKEESPPSGDTFKVVGGRDIGHGGSVSAPIQELTLSGRMRDRAELQRLESGDILISTKGQIGLVGLVDENLGENWVANQIFQVIRLKKDGPIQSPIYLFRYLASPLNQAYLKEQTTGSALPVIKTTDIKELPVPIPSAEEEKTVLQTHARIAEKHQQIKALEQELKVLGQSALEQWAQPGS